MKPTIYGEIVDHFVHQYSEFRTIVEFEGLNRLSCIDEECATTNILTVINPFHGDHVFIYAEDVRHDVKGLLPEFIIDKNSIKARKEVNNPIHLLNLALRDEFKLVFSQNFDEYVDNEVDPARLVLDFDED
jgi:hypothetical protein